MMSSARSVPCSSTRTAEPTACTIDQRRERERADVQNPGHDRHHPADQEPPGGEEADRAAQRMADLDRRGEHSAAVLEQKGEVGSRRRSEREDKSKGHDKPGRRLVAGKGPGCQGMGDPPRFNLTSAAQLEFV
jgi:hypothetical protein